MTASEYYKQHTAAGQSGLKGYKDKGGEYDHSGLPTNNPLLVQELRVAYRAFEANYKQTN